MFQFSKVLFDSSSGLDGDKNEETLSAESQVNLINKTEPHEDGGQEVVRIDIDEGYVTWITVTVSVLGILVLATWTLMSGHGVTFLSLLRTHHSHEEPEVAEEKTGEDEFIFITKIKPQ